MFSLSCATNVHAPPTFLDPWKHWILCAHYPSCPPPLFAFLSLRALRKLRNVCTHLPQCIYHFSIHQYSSFDCFFMSHQASLILLHNIQRISYTTGFKAPQSKMRV